MSHVKIISKMCLELSCIKNGFICFMPQLTSLSFAVRSQRLVELEWFGHVTWVPGVPGCPPGHGLSEGWLGALWVSWVFPALILGMGSQRADLGLSGYPGCSRLSSWAQVHRGLTRGSPGVLGVPGCPPGHGLAEGWLGALRVSWVFPAVLLGTGSQRADLGLSGCPWCSRLSSWARAHRGLTRGSLGPTENPPVATGLAACTEGVLDASISHLDWCFLYYYANWCFPQNYFSHRWFLSFFSSRTGKQVPEGLLWLLGLQQ